MWITEFGIAKFTKELQQAKANLPMWITDSGIVKFDKELQF